MLKKTMIIGIIFIFILSFITHNIYDIFPNFLTSIFFPVNESIWEHTKMIFSTWLLFYVFEFYYLKTYTNKITGILFGMLTNIITLLLIFTPIFFLMNKQDNLIITLIIYLITIILGMAVNYYILKNKKIKINKQAILIILLLAFIYGILTYKPINSPLFYDYGKLQEKG